MKCRAPREEREFKVSRRRSGATEQPSESCLSYCVTNHRYNLYFYTQSTTSYKMSTAPKDFCEGCTCGRAEGGGLAAPEQYAADARDQRSFTAPLDTTPSEGIEPVVPLRSNMWFNNPEDGQYPFCVPGTELIDRYGWMLRRAIPQQRFNLYVQHTLVVARLTISGRTHRQEEANYWYCPDRVRPRSM